MELLVGLSKGRIYVFHPEAKVDYRGYEAMLRRSLRYPNLGEEDTLPEVPRECVVYYEDDGGIDHDSLVLFAPQAKEMAEEHQAIRTQGFVQREKLPLIAKHMGVPETQVPVKLVEQQTTPEDYIQKHGLDVQAQITRTSHLEHMLILMES